MAQYTTKVKISDIQNGLTAKIDGNEIPINSGVIDTHLTEGDHVIKFYSGSTLMFEKAIVVPRSTDELVDLATVGMRTQEEVDQIVASVIADATAGMKTPEQVEAEVQIQVDTALENSQGYIDVTKIDTVEKKIYFTVNEPMGPKAKGINYFKADGTKVYALVPSDRTMGLMYEEYKYIEVLAGNNKVIDKVDFNFDITLPVPVIEHVPYRRYVSDVIEYKPHNSVSTIIFYMTPSIGNGESATVVPNYYRLKERGEDISIKKPIHNNRIYKDFIGSGHIEYLKLYKDNKLLQIYPARHYYNPSVRSDIQNFTKVYTNVHGEIFEETLPVYISQVHTYYTNTRVLFEGYHSLALSNDSHDDLVVQYRIISQGQTIIENSYEKVSGGSAHDIWLEPNRDYKIEVNFNRSDIALKTLSLRLQDHN